MREVSKRRAEIAKRCNERARHSCALFDVLASMKCSETYTLVGQIGSQHLLPVTVLCKNSFRKTESLERTAFRRSHVLPGDMESRRKVKTRLIHMKIDIAYT